MARKAKNKPRVKAPAATMAPAKIPPYQRNNGVVGSKNFKTVPVNAKTKPVKPKPKRANYLRDPSVKPKLEHSPLAWDKIQYLVRKEKGELGWVGAIEHVNDKLYRLHDVGVMDQEASSANFEYDDWNQPVTEMIVAGTMRPGMFAANLGHSHVNMGVRPSGTDEEQMMDLLQLSEDNVTPALNTSDQLISPVTKQPYKYATPFSIQTIYNKKGEVWVAVYDWENAHYYGDCPFTVGSCLTEEDEKKLDEQLKRVVAYKYGRFNGGYYGGGFSGGYYGGSYGGTPNKTARYPSGKPIPQRYNKTPGPSGPATTFDDDDRELDMAYLNQLDLPVPDNFDVTWTQAEVELWYLGWGAEDIKSGKAAKMQAIRDKAWKKSQV